MNSLFVSYAAIRLRLFLREILELHRRILIGFLLFFGLVLSSNEQEAIRRGMAHLCSREVWTFTDLAWLLGIFVYAWIAAAVIRKSARGGRAHYLVESLPLSFAWERGIRAIEFTLINLSILIIFLLGLLEGFRAGGAWFSNILLFLAYYAWILAWQISFLEQSWRSLPFCALGALALMLGKNTALFPWLLMGTAGIGFWYHRQNEAKHHDHPRLTVSRLRVRWRSRLIQKIPAQILMQSTYVMARPGALIYSLLMAVILGFLLLNILRQPIPLSQKIYVYSCITGLLCLMNSSFFRNFHQARMEWQTWLNSLPQPGRWWIDQDTLFVIALFALYTLPVTLQALVQYGLPLLVPVIVLPLHGLTFWVLRRVQRSSRLESGIVLILGSSLWFVMVGYFCDHLVQGVLG